MTIQSAVQTSSVDNHSVPEFTVSSVTSRDGTVITYRQLGRGPAVVILHGAMESAASHMGLARALAPSFTAILPERRGHNLPGPLRDDYSIRQEVEDVDAILARTGGGAVFGVSAGGLIALEAARTLPRVQKIAVYEPAMIVDGLASTEFLTRYDREIAEGKTAAALVSGMLGGQLGPAFLNRMPRWFMELMTRMSMSGEDRKARPGDITMRMLAPTLHYDFMLVAEMQDSVEQFRSMGKSVLLMGGTESPAWLLAALNALEKALPNAARVDFPGLNHGGSSDPSSTNRGGNPALVAEAVRGFLA